MTRARWAISLLLTWHLIAMVAGAIPPPSDLRFVGGVRHPQDDAVAAAVTPHLDSFALHFSIFHERLWTVVGWTRALTRPYLASLGLSQRFRMFANPPRRDEYLRLRYFVESSAGGAQSIWTATELVYPAHREDRVRLLQSFRDSYGDKAIEISLMKHHATELQQPPEDLPPSQHGSEALRPVANYFAGAYQRQLGSEDRVVRAEVWHGSAEGSRRGSAAALRAREALRQEALKRYYQGSAKDTPAASYSRFMAIEREADIVWILEHIVYR